MQVWRLHDHQGSHCHNLSAHKIWFRYSNPWHYSCPHLLCCLTVLHVELHAPIWSDQKHLCGLVSHARWWSLFQCPVNCCEWLRSPCEAYGRRMGFHLEMDSKNLNWIWLFIQSDYDFSVTHVGWVWVMVIARQFLSCPPICL